MSCPTEALSSKDTRNIYPNDQRGHPKCEGSCAGRRVLVKGPSCKELEVGRLQGSNRAENSGKAFDEAGNRGVVELNWYNCVQPVLWKVAAFANEKEYARMHRISREVRTAVSSGMTVGERLKEIMNLDNIPSTNRHYQHCINYQREILNEIAANISKNTLVKDIINVAEAQARFNVEDTAGTFKMAHEAACYQRKMEEQRARYRRDTYPYMPYEHFFIGAQHQEIKAYIGIAEAQVRLFLKEGAADTLRELTRILQTIGWENGYKSASAEKRSAKVDFSYHIDFLITIAKLQARLGLKEKDEAAITLKEAQYFLEKWLGYLDELSHRGDPYIPNRRIVRDMFYNTISFIEAQDRLDPEQKVPLSIRRGQKKLQSILRMRLDRWRTRSIWINEYITFVKLADPKEAINDLREARKTIEQAVEPPEKIIDALGIIIASARGKIDPKKTGMDFKEVYRVAIECKDLPVRNQILQAIVLQGFMLSQKEAVGAFQEVYDILNSIEREEFVLELTKIDVKKESMIVDEMIGSEVQRSAHKALLLTWIAQQHAKFNRKKEAKEIYDHVLDIVKGLQPAQQKEKKLRKIAEGMAEIDHYDKAYEIARDIPSDTYSSNKVKALLKIAKIIREKATSEEDLKKAAVIFEEVREILKTRVGDNIADFLDLFDSSIPVFDQSS